MKQKHLFNGRAMATARRSAGLVQAELARRVSRNRVTISDIERGRLQPSPELAETVAGELDVSIGSLYQETAKMSGEPGASFTIEELQIVDAMRRVGPIERAKIWAFAQGLAAGGGSEGARSAAELAEAFENTPSARKANGDTQTGSA